MSAVSTINPKVGRVVPNAPWPVVRVRDIADSIQYGLTASSMQSPTGPRFLRITDIQDGGVEWDSVPSCKISDADIPKYRLAKGDLVFARTGATTGKSFLIGDCPEAVFASYLIRVRVSKGIDSRYLAAFFQSPDYWAQVEAGKRGIGQPNVNGTVLGEIQMPLPPIPEQRRIVAEIEKQFTRLDAGVTALRRTQANLKRYRAAILKAACEGFLLSSPDSNWPVIPVGEMAHIVTKGSSPNWQGFEYCDTGILFVRSQNVGWGHLDLSDVARLPAGFNEKEKKSVLKAGDVLLNIVGASIGRAAVATIEIEGGNVNQAVAVIRPITSRISSKYLACYLLSDKAQALIHSQKVDVARANLSLEQIRNLPIPLPPLAEQTRIVAEVERRLTVVDELETVVKANLQRATRLRQSILRQAFGGNS